MIERALATKLLSLAKKFQVMLSLVLASQVRPSSFGLHVPLCLMYLWKNLTSAKLR